MDNSISEFNFFIGYESQNVFVYFVVIPLLWCVTIDYKWIHKPISSIAFATLFLVGLIITGGWSQFTDLFYNTGIEFCSYWKQYGYSYAEACIVWCILWPMVITMALMLIPRRKSAQ